MILRPEYRPCYADVRREARSLYWRGWGVTEIAEEFERFGIHIDDKPIPRATIESWKQRERWADDPPVRRAEEETVAKYCMLVAKEKQTGHDIKMIDLLGRQLDRIERRRKYRESGNEADLNPKIANRNAGPKRKPRSNELTADDQRALRDAFLDDLFGYQAEWWENRNHRTRFILKSRQIGATWYFAREALIDALETGRNQIFLSASRRQANIFRRYIIDFVFRVTGKMLKGEHLTIDRGDGEDGRPIERPTLFFLGANYATAQGEHGNFYYDECFWAQDFERTDEVASGMASQKRYRETYFSTPSSVTHQAHKKWTGESYNEGRPKKDWTKIETYHEALKDGALGGDGIWRQIVTVHDAEAKGCDLFDIADLQRRKGPDAFRNLYLCEFIDDTQSAFPFAMLRRCHVDAYEKWSDFDAYALRPFGEGEVAIGYDPQESAEGDDAAIVVIALPRKRGDKFRVLETFRLKGGYEVQAAKIEQLLGRYNVVDIGIDTSGVGALVHRLIIKSFPLARGIRYSPISKSHMVMKAKSVIHAGRLEYDAGDKDITASFVSIRPKLTKSEQQLTFVASRSEETGHADVAWAIMHVLFNEPLDGDVEGNKAIVEAF